MLTREDLQAISGLLVPLETRIGGLETKFDKFEGRVGRLEDRFDKFEQQFEDFKCETRNRFENLEANLQSVDKHVCELDTKVAKLDTKVSDLDGKVTQLDTKVSDLDGKVTQLDTKVSDLDGKVTQLDTKVSDLDGKVTQLDMKVSEVDNSVRSLWIRVENQTEKQLRIVAENYSNLTNKLDELQKMKGVQDTLLFYANKHENDIRAIKQRLCM